MHRSNNPIKLFVGVSAPGVQRVNVIAFLFLTAFAAMEFTLVFLTVERFKFTPINNGMMFVFIGLIIAAVQGGFLRRLAPKFGDRKLIIAGLVLVVPGFLTVGGSGSTAILYVGLGLMATGSALIMPCLSALVFETRARG